MQAAVKRRKLTESSHQDVSLELDQQVKHVEEDPVDEIEARGDGETSSVSCKRTAIRTRGTVTKKKQSVRKRQHAKKNAPLTDVPNIKT